MYQISKKMDLKLCIYFKVNSASVCVSLSRSDFMEVNINKHFTYCLVSDVALLLQRLSQCANKTERRCGYAIIL